MESFADNTIDELIVVNPDPRVVIEITRLIQFKKLNVFSTLEQFVQNKVLKSVIFLSF